MAKKVSTEPKPKGWWHTLPGLIKAIAGLVGALGALLLSLHQAGLFPALPKSPSVNVPSPTPSAPAPSATAQPIVPPITPAVTRKTVRKPIGEAAAAQSSPPVIQTFGVSPNKIAPGEKVKIAWNVSGAKRVEISPLSSSSLASSGEIEDNPQSDTTYTLSAYSEHGEQSASQRVLVQARSTPPIASTKVFLRLKTIYCLQDGSMGPTHWYFKIEYKGNSIIQLSSRNYDDKSPESTSGIAPPAVDRPEALIELPETGIGSIDISGYRTHGNKLSAMGKATVTVKGIDSLVDVVGIPERTGHFKFEFTAKVQP